MKCLYPSEWPEELKIFKENTSTITSYHFTKSAEKIKMSAAIGLHVIPTTALVNGASKFTVEVKLNTQKVVQK